MKKSFFLSVLSALCLGPVAHATQTDNFGIHAVPTPGKVAIDGQLNDWDTSGQVLMTYDIETLHDVYSGQVAAMYDADNLYISIHWKDAIPMGNSHDPRYTANKGWAGDAVQMRIKTDRISHITAWYYAAKQEPAMLIDYGTSLTKPFGGGTTQLYRTEDWKMDQGAEMAFLKDADGKGYVQEIKLPWKLITLPPASPLAKGGMWGGAGDELSIGFELLWGEADWPVHRYADNLRPGSNSREFFWEAHNNWGAITLEPKGQLKLPEPDYMVAYRQALQGETVQGPVEIAYSLPQDARVSLAINDANGNRVRNLIPALPRTQGRNVEKWDGLDDDGKPVPPGNYAFKAIYHDGIHANYVMSFANPGNPTWSTLDNRGAFYGDHTAPQAAAAAGNYVALATPMGEAGKPLIGLNLDGQRLWGLPNRTAFDGGQISLATDGKTLWVANEGKNAIIYRVNIANGQYAPWGVKTKDANGNEFDLLDLQVSEQPGFGTDKTKQLRPNLRAISYHNGTLAIALAREDSVQLLDAQTGAVKQRLAIPAPQSLTFLPDGKLVVLSQGRLMQLTEGATFTALGTAVFPDGYGLASDANSTIYLSVQGTEHNVKVLTPQGQIVREIGKRGGRPAVGPYDANAMRNPAGIAIDSRGHLWVAEQTQNPKRSSVWDAATGQLWKDLPGTTSYAGAGSINPFDSTLGFSDDTVYRLDWEKGTSQPIYSAGATPNQPDELFPPVVHNLTGKVIKRGAFTYLYTSDKGLNVVTLSDGKTFRSVAALGTVPSAKNRKGVFGNALFDGHENEAFAWADANGDGLVQGAELNFAKLTMNGQPITLRSSYWGQLPDSEGTLYYPADPAKGQTLKDVICRVSISGTTPVGAPIYEMSKVEVVKVSQPIMSGGMTMGGKDGRVYVNQNPLTIVNREGRIEATYPSRLVSVHGSHHAKASRPGYLIGPSSFLGTADLGGEIGEVFYLNGNLGENYLFTQDGLYIQTLFKDTRGYFDTPAQAVRGMNMDATTAGGESFGGNFIKAADGKFYLTLGGTDARVLEVTGLDSLHRFDGRFTYTPAQYVEAQHLVQQRAAEQQTVRAYTIVKAATPATIDGKASEWPELLDNNTKLLEIQETSQKRYARVQARYDADNLYLAYRVFGPRTQIKNNGQDDKLMFKTGDAVDLMLGPEKSAKGEGNLRLLLTQQAGQTLAVLNQKVVPNAPKNENYAFSSPWRTINFDRVVEVPEVKMASGKIQGGYFVEATIPWKTLGITPQAGLKLKGDVGALFGDSDGTQTISRQYWSNKATGLVNDIPGEADLSPNLWGTFTLE